MIELDILETQENQLRFHQFDGEEAYQLGTFMAEYAKEHGITIAFSIRLANGYVIFQYGPDGTSFNNQRWMDRKFRTVCNWQKSSLYVTYMLERKGQSLEHHGLDSDTYALCGGGFPIRVNNFEGIVGVILASHLHPVADHGFIVDCLKAYLQKPDVPGIEM